MVQKRTVFLETPFHLVVHHILPPQHRKISPLSSINTYMSYVVLGELQQLHILEPHPVFIDQFSKEPLKSFLGWPGFIVQIKAFLNNGELLHVTLCKMRAKAKVRHMWMNAVSEVIKEVSLSIIIKLFQLKLIDDLRPHLFFDLGKHQQYQPCLKHLKV